MQNPTPVGHSTDIAGLNFLNAESTRSIFIPRNMSLSSKTLGKLAIVPAFVIGVTDAIELSFHIGVNSRASQFWGTAVSEFRITTSLVDIVNPIFTDFTKPKFLLFVIISISLNSWRWDSNNGAILLSGLASFIRINL